MSVNVNSLQSGCFVALITPMTANGAIDFDALKSLIDWHVESGTDGLVILGTTAETATLTDSEQQAVIETALAQNNGRLPLVLGNGSNSTAKTIAYTKQYDELGFAGYLTVTPYYNKPNQKGMVKHFEAVADATDKPIILYNVPSRTGVDLLNPAVIELAKIANITGIKDATGDIARVHELRTKAPNLALFSGDDASSLKFIQAGGHGVISVTGNVAPAKMKQMVSAALAGNDDAAKIDSLLQGLHHNLFIEPNPVPAKWALAQLGKISSEMVRLPLLPLEPIHHSIIKQALLQAN